MTVIDAKVRRDVEEARGLLNAGHRKGAVTGRYKNIGNTVEIEEIEAYCAVALTGLGDRPDTVASRAVVIRMVAGTAKGYRREDLHDAWQRYVSPSSPESVTGVTASTAFPKGKAKKGGPGVTDVTNFGEDGEIVGFSQSCDGLSCDGLP